MATLTIDVNPDLLERAKQHAAARNTTVEQLMKESLAGIGNQSSEADERNEQLVAAKALFEWAEQHPFNVEHGSYTRDELNERS